MGYYSPTRLKSSIRFTHYLDDCHQLIKYIYIYIIYTQYVWIPMKQIYRSCCGGLVV